MTDKTEQFNAWFEDWLKDAPNLVGQEALANKAWQACQAHNDTVIAELLEALEDAEESLSVQKDFNTCDRVYSAIAKHKVERG